jgi:hypothetical protein
MKDLIFWPFAFGLSIQQVTEHNQKDAHPRQAWSTKIYGPISHILTSSVGELDANSWEDLSSHELEESESQPSQVS